MKWTEDMTYKFVREYLKHECLYNCKDPKYKNKGARDAALQQLSEVMDITGFGSKEAYSKLRNLKSTYSQELKKIKDSTRSGAGTDDIYIPQVKWFKLLNATLNSINVQCRDSQSDMKFNSQHEVVDRKIGSISQHNQYSYSDEEEEGKSPIPRKRMLRDCSRLVNNVRSVADTINTSTQTETEFDIFGKSVAVQLKSMPLQLAIQGQMFIQNYLCSLRLHQMGQKSASDVSSPSSVDNGD